MRAILRLLFVVALVVSLGWVFFGRSPGGISAVKYSEFERTRPPKLLYSCTRTPTRESLNAEVIACAKLGRSNCEAGLDDLVKKGTVTNVYVVAGSGKSKYDELLKKARRDCARSVSSTEQAAFEILEADES
jgi:hypothetical protein